MPRKYGYIPAASWEQYDLGNAYTANRRDLESAVRRAAKTANQRLRRLEAAGMTTNMYKSAMRNLDGRKRYTERPGKLTMAQLRHEYAILRDFLSAKTSLVQGQREADLKRYDKARSLGFEGSYEEFYNLVEKLFTEEVESLFSSNTIYKSIRTGTTDVLLKAVERHKKSKAKNRRSRALLDYLKAVRKKGGK